MLTFPSPDRHARNRARFWTVAFLIIVFWLGSSLSTGILRPWVNTVDFNGAVWSQAAHNVLRAGMVSTAGASSGFYFGPLPIPPAGYYLHHPPLLHLALAGMFSVFGEHEWVARLLPICCSIASVTLLWLLVRSCAGARVATFSAAVFASLPMELRYGEMVNFEPVILMLILGVLLCFRYWRLYGHAGWRTAALALIVAGMWVDWAMYLFALVLCIYWFAKPAAETKKLPWILLGLALVSAVLYFLRIRLLQPDAWNSIARAFTVRIASDQHLRFSEMQWLERIIDMAATHFLPLNWLLAATGVFVAWRKKNEDTRWLLWACGLVFAMDALFVGLFQNESYIHEYIALYLVAPMAATAGIALDALASLVERYVTRREFRAAGVVVACGVICLAGFRGEREARALSHQFHVLDLKTPEPPELIPALGKIIRTNFPTDAHILCNFLPVYGPHLGYYAQRTLLNNLTDANCWKCFLAQPAPHVGGVIWMGGNGGKQIVAHLPPGTKQFLTVGNVRFCVWKPAANFRTIQKSS